MTVTTLDPKCALIVVDLQKGVVGLPLAPPVGGVLTASKLLIDAFRHRGLPVVLVNVTGGAPGRTERKRGLDGLPADWADLVPELNAIIGWVEQLGEVNTDGVEPLTAVIDQKLRLREDVVTEGGQRDAILAKAPQGEHGFFAVPKVVE